MKNLLLPLSVAASVALAVPARSDDTTIRVVSDIPALSSVASELLQNVSHDALSLIARGDNPHHLSLRPSQARAVEAADVIVWVGPDLSPWMQDVIAGLGSGKEVLVLGDGEAHHDEHDDEHGDEHKEDEHGHDDHAEHDDDHKDEHDDHKDEHADEHEEHDEHAGHGHHDGDPHHWLDMHKIEAFADHLSLELIKLQPASAAQIISNLEAFEAKIENLETTAKANLAALENTNVIVLHDSYRQLTDDLGITTLSTGIGHDDSGLSAKDARALQGYVAQDDTNCLLVPWGTSEATIATLTQGSDINVFVVDHIGDMDTSYLDLMEKLSSDIAACLS